MAARRKKPAQQAPSKRHSLEAAVESTWAKLLTRIGMPALFALALFFGRQYWDGVLEEITALRLTDNAIREEVKQDRKQNADTNKEVVQTLNEIQKTVGQQQILIQQQYNELKDDDKMQNRRLDKMEDRLNEVD